MTPILWNISVRSLNSLWRIVGKPRAPQVHPKACSTENWLPYTQLKGSNGGRQPYQRQRASQKATLCKLKPCSHTGSVVSQLEEPFSVANSIEQCKDGDNKGKRASRHSTTDWWWMHTCICTCIHTYVCTCIHTYVCTCIHTYICTCMHTHIYISFIHTYISYLFIAL